MANLIDLPLVALQGMWVSRRLASLPAAAGPTRAFTASPVGPPVRLLVVGESTAAGCGADTHDGAFTGAFARVLEEQRGRQVRWAVYGESGVRIRRLRHHVLPNVTEEADVAVLLIGVNDVVARTPVAQWREDLAAVLDDLRGQADTVIMAGIPRFESFPALPSALRGYLAERGRALDGAARALCAERSGVIWVESPATEPAADFFARDGFHPSVAGYERWARHLGSRLAARGVA